MLLACCALSAAPALAQQPAGAAQGGAAIGQGSAAPAAPAAAQSSGDPAQAAVPAAPGRISGTVTGPSGALLGGVRVLLMREGQPPREAFTGEDGQFAFEGVTPGPFQLAVSATGFTARTVTGALHEGEGAALPEIVLAISASVTELNVTVSTVEVAEIQLKEQEQQRIFAVIPNFYVSYEPHAAPLSSKQKFQLAWKTTIDPVSFVLIGVVAGIEQSQNSFSGYGQGAQGYGKRYGAAFADTVSNTFIGGAILPSLLKQDPRYFYKGSGSVASRVFYAIANAVICKSDRGHWQPNYSGIMGSIAAGGISNLYYPQKDRGAELVFQNAGIGIGVSAAVNLFEEFLIRKLTPNLPKRDPGKSHAKMDSSLHP